MSENLSLNIKIQLTPRQACLDSPGIIYHWNRIIMAGLLLVLALVFFGWGLRSLLSDEETGLVDQNIVLSGVDGSKAELEISSFAVSGSAEPFISKEGDNSTSHNSVESLGGSLRGKDAVVLANIDPNTKQLVSLEGKELAKATVEPASAPLHRENTSLRTTIFETTAVKAPVAKSIVGQVRARDASVFTADEVEVFSSQVRRFSLAQRIFRKEPVGTIAGVSFSSDGVASVYAYSDVRGLQGEAIYYRWRLNGKDQAKVKVAIHGERWRSYSSKVIQSTMQGDWSVSLENASGVVLAHAKFELD